VLLSRVVLTVWPSSLEFTVWIMIFVQKKMLFLDALKLITVRLLVTSVIPHLIFVCKLCY